MEKTFWEERYLTHQTGWDLGDVSPPLKAYIDQLPRKNIAVCIPGCGYGHEAIYLEQSGFTNVTVIDLVDDALANVKTKAPSVRCIHGDFFELEDTFDLIIEQTMFCAIHPSMRSQYVHKIAQLLKPSGKLIGVLFNRDFEGGPPFGGSISEYQQLFTPVFSNFSCEPCYNSIAPRSGSEVFIKASV
jgi:SAM-dependent methyltransferase